MENTARTGLSHEQLKTLRDAVEARRDDVLLRLRSLVEQETPSADRQALDRFAEALADSYQAVGATVTRYPDPAGTSLLIDVAGRPADKPLLLIGHSDTVWPKGTLQGEVPWKVEGDRIAGPGVFDMKSGLVAIETALAVLRDAGLDHRPLRIVVVADEEVGSPSSRDLLLTAADGVEAALGFESPHPDGTLKAGRLGSTRATLTVTGREAHAALDPEKGVSAIDELVDQLAALRALVAGVNARGTGRVLLNVGGLSGGGRANVVAGRAEALIGLRFENPEVEEAVLGPLRRLSPVRSGADVRFRVLTHRPAWTTSTADATLLQRVSQVAASCGQQLSGAPAAGAADTNAVGARGIPTLDGFGPRGGGAHAATEHILFSSLLERTVLLAALFHSL